MSGEKKKIKELEQEIEILKALVIFDPLTGLYTRSGFTEEVLPFFHEIEYARERPEKRRHLKIDALSLLFIDIDNFKQINDSKGHAAGDKALKKIAELVSRSVRAVDFVSRWGGEEIVVALLGAGGKQAVDIAEKVRATIGAEADTTVSVGVAELTKDVNTLNGLVERADKAMYEAKKSGKNRVIRYSKVMKA